MLLRVETQLNTDLSHRLSTAEGATDARPAVATDDSAALAAPAPSTDSSVLVDRHHIASRMRSQVSVAGDAPMPRQAAPAGSDRAALSQQPVGSAAQAVLRWDGFSLHTLASAAQRQGLLTAGDRLLDARVAHGITAQLQAPARFTPDALAMLAHVSGVVGRVLNGAQLAGAAHFVNSAADLPQQQGRLAQVLDTIRSLASQRPPERSVQEMKDELKMTFNLPDKAFKKLSDAQIRAKYHELMNALNGPAGNHQFKVGKYKVNFQTDGNGTLVSCNVKKRGLFAALGNFFKKFGSTLLTICSFIPIPWIAIPARIVSGVIAVVNAVKQKSVLGVVAGVASVVAGGAGAVLGKALGTTATVVEKAANVVAKGARAVEAGMNAVKSGNALGVVSAAASLVGAVAGGIGAGAESIAKTAEKVGEWSNRVLVGKEVLVSIKNGQFVQAASKAAGLVADVAGEVKGGDKLASVAGRLQTIAGYVQSADGVVQAIRSGDVAGIFFNGAGLANGIDRALGNERAEGEQGAVARYLNYTGSAVQLGSNIARGDAASALGQAGALFGSVVTQEFGIDPTQAGSGWANSVHRALHNGGKVLDIIADLRNGSTDTLFELAPGVLNDVAWDLGMLTGLVPQREGLTRDNWQVKQDIAVWTGRGQQAWDIVGQVRQGHYLQAAQAAASLAGELGVDSGWTDRIHRVIALGGGVVSIGRAAAKGDIDGMLDHVAAVVARHGNDSPVGSHDARVAADIAIWLGRGAEAVRIGRELHAREHESALQRALQLTLELGIIRDAHLHDQLQTHGADVIRDGFVLGRSIDSGDVLQMLQAAEVFAQSAGGLLERRAA